MATTISWSAVSRQEPIGSGLGLSHAKLAIEELHGGKIEVRSLEQAGKAYLTIFTVTLPIVQTDRLRQEERHAST